MKLYHAVGACSFAPLLAAVEADLPLEIVHVDIGRTPHVLADGSPYAQVSPKDSVPALRLDDGELLTENAAILPYLADLRPASGLAPAPGTPARVRLHEALSFVGTELHKAFSPWLFHPEVGAQAQAYARGIIARRLAHAEHLLERTPWLLGAAFTVADAYLFTILEWSGPARVDLSPWAAVRAWQERVAARPAVRVARRLGARA